eukprot:3885257-Pyramimonas_sp.AAC.1
MGRLGLRWQLGRRSPRSLSYTVPERVERSRWVISATGHCRPKWAALARRGRPKSLCWRTPPAEA